MRLRHVRAVSVFFERQRRPSSRAAMIPYHVADLIALLRQDEEDEALEEGGLWWQWPGGVSRGTTPSRKRSTWYPVIERC